MMLRQSALMILLLFAAEARGAQPLAGLPFLERCAVEGMRLWRRALCAPVVAVDPTTGSFWTSAPAPGPLPSIRANTAFKWGGQDWIMVLDPLPGGQAELLNLLFHESFHVHQQALGLPSNNVVAGHLGGMQARYLLRLEWKALAAALRATGETSKGHVAQALAFRARRLAGNPTGVEAERQQMRHEGLASYTGAALSGAPTRMALAALEAGPDKSSFARSFAYASGPAWGLLLDRLRPGWRRELGAGEDLPDMIPLQPAAIALPDRYGGSATIAEESLVATRNAAALRAALAATAPARALMLPLAQMQMDFDPDRVSTAPDGSQLYDRITLGDRWGRIKVDGWPLRIAPDYSAAFVPWPLVEGALQLSPGWAIEQHENGGAKLIPTASADRH